MQIINEIETVRRLPFEQLIPALQKMFVAGCKVPLRHSHVVENGNGDSGTLLLMPAWQEGKRMGVKTVSIFPANQKKGLPGLHSVYILYDATTGAPLAMLDGDAITSRRTAAASALAATYLSRPDAKTLLVVGAGRVASLLPEAYRTVRPIERIIIWDINRPLAASLAGRLREKGLNAASVEDLQGAVAEADIVSCATLSTAPLIHGEWLRPGTHLDLIGGFTPAMRESDDECFRKATVFVDTDEAALKAGDILEPIRNRAFSIDDIAGDLTSLCDGKHRGRKSREETTLFKAVGTALEDLAAASLALDFT